MTRYDATDIDELLAATSESEVPEGIQFRNGLMRLREVVIQLREENRRAQLLTRDAVVMICNREEVPYFEERDEWLASDAPVKVGIDRHYVVVQKTSKPREHVTVRSDAYAKTVGQLEDAIRDAKQPETA